MAKINSNIEKFLLGILCTAIFSIAAHAQDLTSKICDDHQIHIVKDGENLNDISLFYGSEQFESIIYNSNSDIISSSKPLVAGTELKIPINIAQYEDSGLSLEYVLSNPFCPANTNASDSAEQDISDDEMLEKFREAFQKLADEEPDTTNEQIQADAERSLLFDMSGMVIDETRSKVGRDFYDVFYQNWTAPEDVSGFTITISEQPAPGLGTIVSVTANDTETFRYRLQPRYDFIQEGARYAVRITYKHLQDNPQDYVIY